MSRRSRGAEGGLSLNGADIPRDLFDARVQRRTPGECWPWTGSRHADGYGRLSIRGGTLRQVYAHRAAYALAHGTVPAGAVIMHDCDNRSCCNPAHLRAGTQLQNMRDCVARGRHPSQRRIA